MKGASVATTVLFLAATHILTILGKDCHTIKWSRKNKTCNDHETEVYREEREGPKYLRVCCLPGSEDEKVRKRDASNCRQTKCVSSTKDPLCSTLHSRFIDGRKLEYEEVMRDPCTRKRDGGSGAFALCCQPNSTEGMLVTSLGAEPHEFPHQAKLHGCGGTVYNKRFIITACHCVVDKQGKVKDVKGMKVILGTNVGEDVMELDGKEYVYDVKRIIPHERYSKLASNDQNELKVAKDKQRRYSDIALLELKKDIQFSDKIKALEVAPANFDPFAYADNAVLVGWGTTETLALAVHLQKSNLILRRDDRCISVWGKLSGLEAQILCAGGVLDGQYSWTAGGGDSGGPAICRKADGHPVLCGVTSYGGDDEECRNNVDKKSCPPTVFAEVSFFRDWLERQAGRQDPKTLYQPYLYGVEVPPSKYHHQVHITSSEGKSCGGTLVRPDIVVTAAQCVMNGDGETAFSNLTVTTGVNDLRLKNGEMFQVTKVKVLEGLKSIGKPMKLSGSKMTLATDSYFHNDLAVIKLERSTSLTQEELPRLPRNDDVFHAGVEIAYPRNTALSGQMRSREFKLLNLPECTKRMKRVSGYTGREITVEDNLLCGVEKYSGGSTCDRELGGGLLCKGGDGEDVLCGIQTFRLCMLSIPNGFIDVRQQAKWVGEKIQEMA